VQFRILGPLKIEAAAGEIQLGGAKQRALLALLLLHANEFVPAARLIDLLWSESPPADSSKALQIHVSRLRRALGDADVLQTRPGGYLFVLDDASFDLARFEELAAEGRRLLAQDDAAAARRSLGEALELWRGTPLADVAGEPFAQLEIARLEERRLSAIEDRVEADLLLGAHAQLVGDLEALVARHPLRERLRSQLMLTLYRCGRQAEALEAYRNARTMLVGELGIEPGKALHDLEQAILRQDAALDLPGVAAPSEVRPGRHAAGVFVGRERELDELTAAVEDAAAGRGRLFLISGESGVGKTRLADELASRAKEAGARVLWARSWKGGDAPPYWSWTQLLRSVGEDLPAPEASAEQGARFRLFNDVASALRRAGAQQPLLLVLDDLHLADESSLLLLDFVAGELAEMSVAIVGTYGDEMDPPPALAALAGHAAHHRLRLCPLTVENVARLLDLGGVAPADAATVHAETGGNPRLVWQRVR
jgi:DNA-binding SARP family transcriptional activator